MAKPKTHGPRGRGASSTMRPPVSPMAENARLRIGTARGGWRQNGRKMQQRTQGYLSTTSGHVLRQQVVSGGPHPNRPGPGVASDAMGDTKLPSQPQDTVHGQESERS